MRVEGQATTRELDRYLIEEVGIPSLSLMEIASRQAALHIKDLHSGGLVCVVAGPGNNAGDGYGVARWLFSWSIPVVVWPWLPPSSDDCKVMQKQCIKLGIPIVNTSPAKVSLWVDALFGTGLLREISGSLARGVQWINSHKAQVVSLDIPSGVCADTGRVLGVAFVASSTVTFGCRKLGMYGHEAQGRIGEIIDVDLGFSMAPIPITASINTPKPWPKREEYSHKSKNGHLLVIAGSGAMAGAARLVCLGALASGCGLVTLLGPRSIKERLGGFPPEVMYLEGEGGKQLKHLRAFEKASAVIAGPGLGGGVGLTDSLTLQLRHLWANDERPVLFDADALLCTSHLTGGERVLTPHVGEAARLLNCTVEEVNADRFSAARRLHSRGVAVLKGPHTIISSPQTPQVINTTGGANLASGGSGDVLSGLISGLLARGVPAKEACELGVYFHGEAGTMSGSFTPSRLLEVFSQVIKLH